MTDRNSKTSIVFPRISNHDGPAKTLYKDDFYEVTADQNNPLANSLAHGFSDQTTQLQPNLRLMIALDPPIFGVQETRNGQRFSNNYKKPDHATKNLIKRRRPV